MLYEDTNTCSMNKNTSAVFPAHHTPYFPTHTGVIADLRDLGVWDAYAVKVQTLKTSVEAATLLLRIDDIVSGISKKKGLAPGQSAQPTIEDPDAVDPEAMLGE